MIESRIREAKVDDGYIEFKDMRPYDIGRCHPDSNYPNEIVMCVGDEGELIVSLSNSSKGGGSCWGNVGNNTIKVKLFPKGTVIELEVQ